MRGFLRCGILGLMAIFINDLFAARPFATDDAGTVEQSIHELECGCDFWSDEAALGLGFKHGLTERMDLGVSFSYVVAPEENNGFESAELGVKFALIPDVFAASLTGTFGEAAYSLNAILTRDLGPLEIDSNIGYKATGIVDEDGTISYGLALIFEVGSYAVGIEGSGNKDGLQSWLVGGRYTVFDEAVADIGISGWFEDDEATTATVGIHHEF